MHCSRCGAQMSEDDFYCTKCGFLEDIAVKAKIKEKKTKVIEVVDSKAFGGFWRRFGALFLDVIVLIISELVIIVGMGFAIFGMALFGKTMIGKGAVEHHVILSFVQGFGSILAVGLCWVYYTGLESSKWQATLGKKLLNMQVTDLAGRRITFGQANLRYWSKIVSAVIFGIGFIMVVFNKKKRALHDLFAGTQIMLKKVHLPKPEAKTEEKLSPESLKQ